MIVTCVHSMVVGTVQVWSAPDVANGTATLSQGARVVTLQLSNVSPTQTFAVYVVLFVAADVSRTRMDWPAVIGVVVPAFTHVPEPLTSICGLSDPKSTFALRVPWNPVGVTGAEVTSVLRLTRLWSTKLNVSGFGSVVTVQVVV
jgi:hypothetical protein